MGIESVYPKPRTSRPHPQHKVYPYLLRGTPQGGVISPLLANLFLHYAFDRWMATNFPKLPFCRYADDALIHCRSLKQANYLRKRLSSRLKECGLELHPVKTKVVYCKDIHREQE